RVLEEDKAAVLEAKNRERTLMQSYNEKSSTFEVNAKALKKMSKQTAQMKGFEDQVNSAKAIEKEVKQGKTKLTDDGIQEISLEAKLVEREGKADQVDQQKEQLQKEKELKYEQGSKEFNKVKIDVESRRHTLEAIGRRVEAVFVKMDSTKVKISSCKDSGTARQQLLLKKLEEILYEFHLYNQSANAVLSKIDAPSG
ncbi:Kinetochore protein NUF2-like protein, partial [Drosera capensis]